MADNALGAPSLTLHEPNYDTRGPNLLVCSVVLLVIPSITVLVRFWSRAVTSAGLRNLWWDDYMLLATLLFSHLYLAFNIWGIALGLGKHAWMVPIANAAPSFLQQRVSLVWYFTVITLTKLSALTFYARVFRVSTTFRYIVWGLAGIITAFWVGITIEPWTNCRPVCTARDKYYVWVGSMNVLFDLIILIIPMPLIWALQLKLKKKLLLCLVFLLGYCSAILSLTRLILVASKPSIVAQAPGSDPTWDVIPILYISSLEAPFAIVALCGPSINQIVRRAQSFGWRSLLSTKEFTTYQHGSYNTPRSKTSSKGNTTNGTIVSRNDGNNYKELEGRVATRERTEEENLKKQTGGNVTDDVEMVAFRERGAEFV